MPWQPEKMPVRDPAEMSEIVKDTALFLGASLVGITELNRNWVYKPGWERYAHKEIDLDRMIPPSVKYAVVMAIETNYDFVKYAPTAKASAAAGLGYSKMAFLAPSLAKFIASLGYKAIACGNDTALSVPLAVDAGLGQLARFGALITPEFGPRIRLCKVLTDLPLKPTAPIDFGVTEFCEVCEKCAQYCPSQAILYGKRTPKPRTVSTNPGLLKWPLDGEKCLRFWFKNGAKTDKGMYHIDCYQCINVCPFNKKAGVGHDLVRWLVRRKSRPRPFTAPGRRSLLPSSVQHRDCTRKNEEKTAYYIYTLDICTWPPYPISGVSFGGERYGESQCSETEKQSWRDPGSSECQRRANPCQQREEDQSGFGYPRGFREKVFGRKGTRGKRALASALQNAPEAKERTSGSLEVLRKLRGYEE